MFQKQRINCPNCNGYGIVADYGNGEDFYGAKECKYCKGSGLTNNYAKKKETEENS